MKKHLEPQLLLDGARGMYIPRDFAHGFNLTEFGFTKEEMLSYRKSLSDPDNEDYWMAWEELMDQARTVNGETLSQEEGDLWLQPADPEWVGLDADLYTSLCEYGFVLHSLKGYEGSEDDEYRTVHSVPSDGQELFAISTVKESFLDNLIRGGEWMDKEAVTGFLEYCGRTEQEWLEQSMVLKVSTLCGYVSTEDLFGVPAEVISKEKALNEIGLY